MAKEKQPEEKKPLPPQPPQEQRSNAIPEEEGKPSNRAIKPGMIRVRALSAIAEEDDRGDMWRYKAGDVFDIPEPRAAALKGLVKPI